MRNILLLFIVISVASCKPTLNTCVDLYGGNKIVKIDTVIHYDTVFSVIDTTNNTFSATFDSLEVSKLDSGESISLEDSIGNTIELIKISDAKLKVVANRKPQIFKVPVKVKVPFLVEVKVPCFEDGLKKELIKQKDLKSSWRNRFLFSLSIILLQAIWIFRKPITKLITKI